jgi:hypothetical protein
MKAYIGKSGGEFQKGGLCALTLVSVHPAPLTTTGRASLPPTEVLLPLLIQEVVISSIYHLSAVWGQEFAL